MLVVLLQFRINRGEATKSERAYAQHYQGCFQCFTAPGVTTMCSLGKHLYHKLQYQAGATPQERHIPPCGACGHQSEDLSITGCDCACHELFAGIFRDGG